MTEETDIILKEKAVGLLMTIFAGRVKIQEGLYQHYEYFVIGSSNPEKTETRFLILRLDITYGKKEDPLARYIKPEVICNSMEKAKETIVSDLCCILEDVGKKTL